MAKTVKNIIIDLLPSLFPIIIIITIIACSLRITYIIKNKEKFVFYKELFSLIFILYVMCLFEIVTIQDTNFGTSNYIPFKEILRYTFGTRLYVKNIIGNVLLFLPYGYFVSYYLNSKRYKEPVILSFIVSITIELVQLNIGRVFDIDDIILNTIGGLFGYYLYSIINNIRNKLPGKLKNDGVANFVVITIIIILIIYFMNLNILDWFS